ncbi:hypothetical protein [Streptomyces cacaoi]|uniref:hypothetical protein n=1 Tax=Streptomyces cacaoi TaxID=1898 RepID=UPI0026076386|nr:hypothetical protein [Streptomyces cacaoi]
MTTRLFTLHHGPDGDPLPQLMDTVDRILAPQGEQEIRPGDGALLREAADIFGDRIQEAKADCRDRAGCRAASLLQREAVRKADASRSGHRDDLARLARCVRHMARRLAALEAAARPAEPERGAA